MIGWLMILISILGLAFVISLAVIAHELGAIAVSIQGLSRALWEHNKSDFDKAMEKMNAKR